MSKKSPGKSYREGVSLVELFKMFPDDETSEKWFVGKRWPDGPICPHCGSSNVQSEAKHRTMPYRCREKHCTKRFSAKTGTVMEGSKLGFQTWMIATYLMTTSLKGVSSMKLHRDLDINQRSAWFLGHRLRVALAEKGGLFAGPVEVDETFIGGKRKNMSNAKRKALKDTGRGAVGKAVVVGAKDRETNKVRTRAVKSTDTETLHGFVKDHAEKDTTIYTDDARAYDGLPFDHESVRHSLSEYVRGDVHTNGIESHWSMFKRGYHGTYHKMSPKHLDRYVQEFAGRHNLREMDTLDIMGSLVSRMDSKRLKYDDLIAGNGLPNGAR